MSKSDLSLSQRIYWNHIKPHLSNNLRKKLRQMKGQTLALLNRNTWPILESAGEKPTSWTGWPDGKQFGFVLTHDVEGQRGVLQSQSMAKMEKELGFKSAFYFVPEGKGNNNYNLSSEKLVSIMNSLREEGFEIGVHDLDHTMQIYDSMDTFFEASQRINDYLAHWRAVGFRAGQMRHNLSWHGWLDIEYDTSTFDTDPFEPQPDGVETIFPFVVQPSHINQRSYVELPCTLAQDSTVFLTLGKKDDKLWRDKIDWIAEKGGMALLNVHPDYVSFEGGGRNA